jgi:polyphosphate kinase
VTYTRTQDDEEVSAVLEILEDSEESSELYLTDTEDEDLDTRNNNSTELAQRTIPFTPVQLDDTNNLPFMQTFIANIFIF